MVRLKPAKDWHYYGVFNYLVSYDYAAGSANRYTVMVLNCDDPVIIGRELPMSCVRPLIRRYEEKAKKLDYIGERADVLKCMHELNLQFKAQPLV